MRKLIKNHRVGATVIVGIICLVVGCTYVIDVHNRVAEKDREIRAQVHDAQDLAVDEIAKEFSNVNSVEFDKFTMDSGGLSFSAYLNRDHNKRVHAIVKDDANTKKKEVGLYYDLNEYPEKLKGGLDRHNTRPGKKTSNRENIKIIYNTKPVV